MHQKTSCKASVTWVQFAFTNFTLRYDAQAVWKTMQLGMLAFMKHGSTDTDLDILVPLHFRLAPAS